MFGDSIAAAICASELVEATFVAYNPADTTEARPAADRIAEPGGDVTYGPRFLARDQAAWLKAALLEPENFLRDVCDCSWTFHIEYRFSGPNGSGTVIAGRGGYSVAGYKPVTVAKEIHELGAVLFPEVSWLRAGVAKARNSRRDAAIWSRLRSIAETDSLMKWLQSQRSPN